MAIVWGCRKDVEEFRPYTPTLEDLGQLFSQLPDASSHTLFPFGGSIPDTTLTTASGVRVFLADTENLFADDTGTPIPCSTCPSLKIEATTVLSKGDLIARDLPTVEIPGYRPLETAGAVYIQATCQGKALHLLPDRYLKVQIPATDVKTDMKVYAGALDGQNQLTGWDANSPSSSVFWAEWPLKGGGVQTGYELIVPQLGWSSCARPLIEQSSPFCVTLPGQFSALNTRVFLIFQNMRVVAELTGDDNSSEFCFPAAPLGYPIRVVVVSKTGGQYWLTNHFTEIGSNVVLPLAPQPKTDQEVLDFLKSL